jgi:putative CocE/NonD family hydrolase
MSNMNMCAAAEYDVFVARNAMVPLRDGVRLATDLYYPGRNGQRAPGLFPAILMRTPYAKDGDRATGEFYARRGYVYAAQDVRGRFASEGAFYAFKNEGPDGVDVVGWLGAQPWCDGKVGTLGSSYCAAVQSALASLAPPHLAAMVVQFGPSSYYHSAMRHNGALELRFLVYAFSMAASSTEALRDPTLKKTLDDACAKVWEYLKPGPLRRGATPLHLLPAYEEWALDLQDHICYDEHWRAPGWGPRPFYGQHADVPTLYVGGWYDTYTRGTVENFSALVQRQTKPVHLLIGPWTHGGVGVPEAGDLTFQPDGGVRYEEDVRLPWFEQWLKGRDLGLATAAPVKYYVMGDRASTPPPEGKTIPYGIAWRDAPDWPPPVTVLTPFYFHSGGKLDKHPPAAPADSATTFLFDPENPVPTIGGNLSAMPLPAGGFDQRGDPRFVGGEPGVPLAARPDVLCFMSKPLAEDLEIAGPVKVILFVSSSAPDTDFTAKLVDVFPPTAAYPDGAAINLTDSIGRLRFREGYEEWKLAEPGTVYDLIFELYPTACRFRKGHRIRVDISSSNYPRFDVNPNTGEHPGKAQVRCSARNTLHHSSAYRSCILLPVQAS